MQFATADFVLVPTAKLISITVHLLRLQMTHSKPERGGDSDFTDKAAIRIGLKGEGRGSVLILTCQWRVQTSEKGGALNLVHGLLACKARHNVGGSGGIVPRENFKF